jgi:phosphoserine phosphatase
MSILHLFDMDGTLLRDSTASLELARRLGHLEKVRQYERASAEGEIDSRRFHELCQTLWVDATEADVEAAFAVAPWMLGLREVLADIAARGEFSAVISLSPSFWVERLLAWGAGSVHATEVVLGSVEVDHAKVLTARSKVVIADRLCKELALSEEECVAYGDSRSDVELFSVLPFTVAVNGDPAIERLAKASYQGLDLRVAYALGRGLISQRERTVAHG